MRQITYRMTTHDRLEAYKVGLSHMNLLYRAVWVAILMVWLAGPIWYLRANGYPSAFPPTTLPPRPLVVEVCRSYGIFIGVYLLTSIVSGEFTRQQTLKLLQDYLLTKTLFRWKPIRWRNVTNIVETAEHICFCQNIPYAVVVPKSAFPSSEHARAFVEQAGHYWRRETGRKDPLPINEAGVWPPAPGAVNSPGPGENAKH